MCRWLVRALKLVFVLGVLLGGLPMSVVVAQQPVTLDAYWQRLETLRERVANGETAAVASELEQLTAVSLPNDTVLTVDHSFLSDALRRDDAESQQLLGLFDALLAQKRANLSPTPEQLMMNQAALDEILQQDEFQYEASEPTLLQQWWQDIQDRFWAFMGRLFPDPNTPLGQVVGRIGVYGGALLLMLVLGMALRSLLSGFVTEATLHHEEDAAEFLTADSAFARAQELSSGGDYRTAVRYLYLSALLLLEEQGLLRYDRSRTNREYLRSLSHKPELARILREVVEVFDRVWYGYQPLDKAGYEAYVSRVEALKQQR